MSAIIIQAKRIPWNKGKTGLYSSSKKGKTYEELYGVEKAKQLRYAAGNGNRGKPATKNQLCGLEFGRLKGRKCDTEQRNTMSKLAKKQIREGTKKVYFKKGHYVSDEIKRKISEKNKLEKNIASSMKNLKAAQKMGMSGLERKFNEIIKKNNLPYAFVGNGDFYIENKNPDFINTNGEKIAIEVYSKSHKEKFRGKNIEDWKQERDAVFGRYGWRVLYFDAPEINEENIFKQLKGDLYSK